MRFPKHLPDSAVGAPVRLNHSSVDLRKLTLRQYLGDRRFMACRSGKGGGRQKSYASLPLTDSPGNFLRPQNSGFCLYWPEI
jgi:hypothetical protein